MRDYRQRGPSTLLPRVLVIISIVLVIGVVAFLIFGTNLFHTSNSGNPTPNGSAISLTPGNLTPTGVGSVVPASTVQRYEKYEITLPYSGNYSNPNDPAQVDVEAVFSAPGGNKLMVPGFFYQDFTRSGNAQKETLTLVPGSDRWKVRFAPSEVGTYTFIVTIRDAQGFRLLAKGSFNVTPSSNPGFIRAAGLHLQRDNGQPFIPLGINAPWFQSARSGHTSWGDGTYGVDAMYQQFLANGLNFFHVWTCSWTAGRPQPFAKPNIGCDGGSTGTQQMSQADSWEMDYMVDQAHADNIYLMPILKHLDMKNFEYADKIKARYFVARWGYSTNIVAWDFCKEGCTDPAVIQGWASYISSIDPYKHLLTTSQYNHFSALGATRTQNFGQIFNDPLLTLVQTHDYTPDCTSSLYSDPGFALFYMKLDPSGTDPRGFHNFNKPSFFGETGVHGGGGGSCVDVNSSGQTSLYNVDHTGLILNNEIWGTLMGTSGAYAPWFFEFDPNGQWTQLVAFKGARAYVNALPPVPDSANLFTNYNKDSSQAVSSDTRLLVFGRKNAMFAMLCVQNMTGTALDILHGGTPSPVAGTVTLKGMQAGTTFTVRWYDTISGAVVTSETVQANSAGLVLTLPQAITQSVAAIITA